ARNQRRAPSRLPTATPASRGETPDRTSSQNRSRTTRGNPGRPLTTTTTTTSASGNRCNHQLNPPCWNDLNVAFKPFGVLGRDGSTPKAHLGRYASGRMARTGTVG